MTRTLTLTLLEDRSLPSATFLGMVSGDSGEVRFVDADTGQARWGRLAFEDGSAVADLAIADINGDTVPDLIVGSETGGRVRLFSGLDGTLIQEFTPFGPNYTGAVSVAAGDLNLDGQIELIVGSGPGALPSVRVIQSADGSLITEITPFETTFTGGVNLAVGDVNGDGRDDILVGAGFGGGPRVRVFSGDTGVTLHDFFAYDSNFRGGVSVAADYCDDDGFADLITGAGMGGAPHVQIFSGLNRSSLSSFFADDPTLRQGVWVSAASSGPNGSAVLLTSDTGSGQAVAFDPINGVPMSGFEFPVVDASRVVANADASDVILTWNERALKTIATNRTAPPVASYQLAVLHTSMFDAVNAIVGGFQAYASTPDVPAGAEAELAAIAAAERVLSRYYPDSGADVALQAQSQLRDPSVVEASLTVGQAAADAVLALREDDGSDVDLFFTGSEEPGEWRPTPPGFASGLLPQWGGVRPFALASGDQVRPGGPASLDSEEYALDFEEVKNLGRFDSPIRSADQTEIALFWADGAGTVTPPGHWNRIAQKVVRESGLSLIESARTMALLNLATADAGIAAWDAKYNFPNWRPEDAIRLADTDGNPDTTPDPEWRPVLVSPPFPDYISGHSTFSAASGSVLTGLFGPNYSFNTFTDALPGVTRTFTSFNDAALEAGMSRIYGGIHFEFANADGNTTGLQVAQVVLDGYLRPI